ncbi:hypothetical protein FISHEDRAFT_62302 [Fistulina hepatica ATCC 64428]|nr:hypothetical protein FISHEDRAFT_62302 [Fistulina hepatica ATCC 64428]
MSAQVKALSTMPTATSLVASAVAASVDAPTTPAPTFSCRGGGLLLWHLVVVGRYPGLYNDVTDATASIEHFPNAQCRGFALKEEAILYWKNLACRQCDHGHPVPSPNQLVLGTSTGTFTAPLWPAHVQDIDLSTIVNPPSPPSQLPGPPFNTDWDNDQGNAHWGNMSMGANAKNVNGGGGWNMGFMSTRKKKAEIFVWYAVKMLSSLRLGVCDFIDQGHVVEVHGFNNLFEAEDWLLHYLSSLFGASR